MNMKKWLNKEKIFLMISLLIILSGIIVLGLVGFEKSATYQAGTRMEVYLPNGYNEQEIVTIAKECFNGKEISFNKIEKLDQVAGIKVKDYTHEELEQFKTKVAEKYNIAKDGLEVQEVLIPATKVSTFITPYVFPVLLITILVLIYLLFRNLKSENKWKILLKEILFLAIALGLYFSLILIFRIPFGSYTMPIALAIYIIILLITVNTIKK